MNDIERTPTGGYLSGDQGELQSLLRSCQHRMLLCGPGVALNSGKARLVIDVQPGDGAPALAVFEAVEEDGLLEKARRIEQVIREHFAQNADDRIAEVRGRGAMMAIEFVDPATGEPTRRLERPSDAGTAFDGTHLWQIAESRIDKIDPATGQVPSIVFV